MTEKKASLGKHPSTGLFRRGFIIERECYVAPRYIKVEKTVTYLCDSCKNMGYLKIKQTKPEPEAVKCWNCKAMANLFTDSVLAQRIQATDSSCFRCGTAVAEETPKRFTKSIQMCYQCSEVTRSRRYLELSEVTYVVDEKLWPVVYFLQPKEGGNIKIGFTRTLYKRFREIQACSPLPLKIVLLINGTEYLEQSLHSKFRKHRLHYEWFKPHKEILDFIDSRINLKRRRELKQETSVLYQADKRTL